MAYKLLKVALFSFWTAACNKIIYRDEPAAGSIDEVIPTTFFDHLPGSLKNKSSSATTGRIFEGKVFREAPKRERFQLCTGCAKDVVAAEWKSGCKSTHWAVLTTIQGPVPAVRNLMKRHGWCLVVVGDKKGPFKYNVEEAETDAIDFLPHEEQEQNHSQKQFCFKVRPVHPVESFRSQEPWLPLCGVPRCHSDLGFRRRQHGHC